MKNRTPNRSQESTRRVLLARMAATRAELAASNHVVDMARRGRSGDNSEPSEMKTPFLGVPSGVAVAVVLAGYLALGPRRLVTTALRAGLVAMIGRLTRAIVQP